MMRLNRPLIRTARSLLAVVLATLLGAAIAQRTPAPDAADIEKRLASVETLIERSSAARQVETSGNATARERRERARVLHRDAVAAWKAGDLARARTLLDNASREMFEGVRVAAPEQVQQDKAKRDFAARLDSTRALSDALKRISTEKASGGDIRAVIQSVDAGMRDAEQLASGGDFPRAQATLDRSYLTAKAAIGGLREGDTLVRSLHFASKEEEYRYEVDRNDTHRMLVKLLVEERRAAAGSAIDGFVGKATQIRGQALSTAERGDFAAAIRLLEDSTRELVRAIRSAGIYIPG